MTNVSKYQMGLKLIPIIMPHLTSNIESSRQLLKETTTILVLTDSTESNKSIQRPGNPQNRTFKYSVPEYFCINSQVGYF